jgi:hypothetical protein
MLANPPTNIGRVRSYKLERALDIRRFVKAERSMISHTNLVSRERKNEGTGGRTGPLYLDQRPIAVPAVHLSLVGHDMATHIVRDRDDGMRKHSDLLTLQMPNLRSRVWFPAACTMCVCR